MGKLLGGLQGIPDESGSTQRVIRKLEELVALAMDRIQSLETKNTVLEKRVEALEP